MAATAGNGRRVHVCVRLRPTIAEDAGSRLAVQCSPGEMITLETRGGFGPFDAVLGASADQAEVYERCGRRVVEAVATGASNGTLLCYGQTGSGKTHSVGIACDGLLPRALRHVFEAVGAAGGRAQYTLWLSCMQIYIEQVEDLLNLGGGVVKLREDSQDPWGPVVVEGLVRHPLSSLEQAMELVRLADGNRAVASTQMNMASSRSHVIFTLFVERSSVVPPDAAPGEVTRLLREAARGPTRTKLHVLDLAGSERLKKTGASGVAVEEARATNMSLLSLGKVCFAPAHQAKDCP